MTRTDIGDTLQARRFTAFSYMLVGTLAAGDYLGDTANSTGLAMSACTVSAVHYNAGTASGTGSEITIHNVTQGTSSAFVPDASAEEVDISDLEFGEGDELAIEVTAVDGTTAGADVSLALEAEQDTIA